MTSRLSLLPNALPQNDNEILLSDEKFILNLKTSCQLCGVAKKIFGSLHES